MPLRMSHWLGLEWLPSDSPPFLRRHPSFDLVQNERLLSVESRSIPPSMVPECTRWPHGQTSKSFQK